MNAADFDPSPYGVIGVAVSGGVDSMCLLHYLHAAGARSVVLCVEHGIRGEESLADVALVEDYCRRLGVPCVVRRVDALRYAAERRIGVEQSARDLRHAFFAEMIARGEVDCVATAHHLDDQVETVLLHLLRGAGLAGLRGIVEREGYIRPFLGYTRREIEEYAARYDVPYREDATNADTAYSRNYLRHVVLPAVEARFPAYRRSVSRLTDLADEQIRLMDSLCVEPVAEGDEVYLPLTAFDGPLALAKWSVAKALRRFDGGVDVEGCHLDEIVKLPTRETGSCVCLPHGVMAALEYDRVTFWRARPIGDALYPFGEGSFDFGGVRVVIRPFREGDAMMFDADKVPADAVLRYRREGDTIAKFGGGTKSLGDYYTDRKVPLRVRERYPVLACDKRVLACVADVSRDVAVDADTKRKYTITMEEV